MSEAAEPPPLEHGDVRGLDPQAWLARLQAAAAAPTLDGRTWPGVPSESFQASSVGSAQDHALAEADNFYRFVLANTRRLARPQRYLDFGCGWGRIGRFFLRDFERGDMVGVDIDPAMLEVCRLTRAPGTFLQAYNHRPLPFADASFALTTAYSVFSHLPADLFRFWMAELLRVTAPGGSVVVTVEPERFIDFVASTDEVAAPSGWHQALRTHLGDPDARRAELARDGLTYLATGGGGPHRPPESYGDTVVSRSFVADAVRGGGRITAWLDDPARFWQAVVVVRRRPSRTWSRAADGSRA